MECSSAHLRYLLVIDRLSEEGGAVSSVEVARALGVKKPSVARMLETLQEKGLAEKERTASIAFAPRLLLSSVPSSSSMISSICP